MQSTLCYEPALATLTKRELEVINLVAFQYSTKEIASKLYISFETVRTHRKNLFSKLGVRNVAGLVRVACELDLINYEHKF